MDHLGVEAVDEIRLAGAFGSQIDPTHAMILGLVPDCDLAQRPLGRQCRRDRARSSRCCRARRGPRSRASSARVEKIETAVEPRFQEHFVEAMAFPHKTAAFPNLGRVVTLPARSRRRPTRGPAVRPRPAANDADASASRPPAGRVG